MVARLARAAGSCPSGPMPAHVAGVSCIERCFGLLLLLLVLRILTARQASVLQLAWTEVQDAFGCSSCRQHYMICIQDFGHRHADICVAWKRHTKLGKAGLQILHSGRATERSMRRLCVLAGHRLSSQALSMGQGWAHQRFRGQLLSTCLLPLCRHHTLLSLPSLQLLHDAVHT